MHITRTRQLNGPFFTMSFEVAVRGSKELQDPPVLLLRCVCSFVQPFTGTGAAGFWAGPVVCTTPPLTCLAVRH